ncbi:MAG: CocE/NonD family hydrolase [Actinomycetota bacterium]
MKRALGMSLAFLLPLGGVTPALGADGSAGRDFIRPALIGQAIPCDEPPPPQDPPPWVSQMPEPRDTTVTKEDVQIESEDGTLLSARYYLPDAYDPPLPTVLILSPYWSLAGLYVKELEDADVLEYADCMAETLLTRGYAVVLGDMRGTHNSDGCFDYGGPGDQADGYAIVQWIADQEWSNGKVGMYGVSHVGMSQYSAAVKAPPALKAILPIAPITSFYRYLITTGFITRRTCSPPPPTSTRWRRHRLATTARPTTFPTCSTRRAVPTT